MAHTKRVFREWQHPRAADGRFAKKGTAKWAAKAFKAAEAAGVHDFSMAHGGGAQKQMTPFTMNVGSRSLTDRVAPSAAGRRPSTFELGTKSKSASGPDAAPIKKMAAPGARRPVPRAAKEAAGTRERALGAMAPKKTYPPEARQAALMQGAGTAAQEAVKNVKPLPKAGAAPSRMQQKVASKVDTPRVASKTPGVNVTDKKTGRTVSGPDAGAADNGRNAWDALLKMPSKDLASKGGRSREETPEEAAARIARSERGNVTDAKTGRTISGPDAGKADNGKAALAAVMAHSGQIPAAPKLSADAPITTPADANPKISAYDHTRIQHAVADHAHEFMGGPLHLGKDDAVRYTTEGYLKDLNSKYGTNTVWDEVAKVVEANPHVLRGSKAATGRRVADRATTSETVASEAATAMKAGEFSKALARLNEGEAANPDYRDKRGRGFQDMRDVVMSRMKQAADAKAERDKEAAGPKESPADLAIGRELYKLHSSQRGPVDLAPSNAVREVAQARAAAEVDSLLPSDNWSRSTIRAKLSSAEGAVAAFTHQREVKRAEAAKARELINKIEDPEYKKFQTKEILRPLEFDEEVLISAIHRQETDAHKARAELNKELDKGGAKLVGRRSDEAFSTAMGIVRSGGQGYGEGEGSKIIAKFGTSPSSADIKSLSQKERDAAQSEMVLRGGHRDYVNKAVQTALRGVDMTKVTPEQRDRWAAGAGASSHTIINTLAARHRRDQALSRIAALGAHKGSASDSPELRGHLGEALTKERANLADAQAELSTLEPKYQGALDQTIGSVNEIRAAHGLKPAKLNPKTLETGYRKRLEATNVTPQENPPAPPAAKVAKTVEAATPAAPKPAMQQVSDTIAAQRGLPQAVSLDRPLADRPREGALSTDVPKLSGEDFNARYGKAADAVSARGASPYHAMKRINLTHLSRAAGLPVKDQSNDQMAAALHARDQQEKAAKAARLNPGSVGTPSTQHETHTTPREPSMRDVYAQHAGMSRAQFDAMPAAEREQVLADLRKVRDSGEQQAYHTRSHGIGSPPGKGMRRADHVQGAEEKVRELMRVLPNKDDYTVEGRARRAAAGDRYAIDGTMEDLQAIASANGWGHVGSWKKPKAVNYLRNHAIAHDVLPKTWGNGDLADAMRGTDRAKALALLDIRDTEGLTLADMNAIAAHLGLPKPSGRDKLAKMHDLAGKAGGAGPKADAAEVAAPAASTGKPTGFRLVRILPDGTEKTQGPFKTQREAAIAAARSLHDNNKASKADAQAFSVTLGRHPAGEDVKHDSGYSFRIEGIADSAPAAPAAGNVPDVSPGRATAIEATLRALPADFTPDEQTRQQYVVESKGTWHVGMGQPYYLQDMKTKAEALQWIVDAQRSRERLRNDPINRVDSTVYGRYGSMSRADFAKLPPARQREIAADLAAARRNRGPNGEDGGASLLMGAFGLAPTPAERQAGSVTAHPTAIRAAAGQPVSGRFGRALKGQQLSKVDTRRDMTQTGGVSKSPTTEANMRDVKIGQEVSLPGEDRARYEVVATDPTMGVRVQSLAPGGRAKWVSRDTFDQATAPESSTTAITPAGRRTLQEAIARGDAKIPASTHASVVARLVSGGHITNHHELTITPKGRTAAAPTAPKAAAKSGEPVMGVTESSRGRTTTVTLPDGTTAARTSKTMTYSHAVVGTTDEHANARDARALADRLDAYSKALEAWIADGSDLSTLKRYYTGGGSYNDEQAGIKSYGYYLPGFEPNKQITKTGHVYYTAAPGAPTVENRKLHKDLTPVPFRYDWEHEYHGPDAHRKTLAEARKSATAAREQAAKLEAGPQYTYAVDRWSQRADTAFGAIGSPEVNRRNTSYQVVTVGGVAKQDTRPAKVVPTAAEKADALEVRKAAEKATTAERNRKFFADVRKSIEDAIRDGGDPEGDLKFKTEAGLRALAREYGVKLPRLPRNSYGSSQPLDRDNARKLIVAKIRADLGKA